MEKDLEYYMNRTGYKCPKLPRVNKYLIINNYLSEYGSEGEKEIVRDNLGVTDKLNLLKTLIDNKVIEVGGVPFDLEPTEGHTGHVLSSDAIYKTLLKYELSDKIDLTILNIWNVLVKKDLDLQNSIDNLAKTIYDKVCSDYMEELILKVNDLKLEFESLLQTGDIQGIPVLNRFGNSEYIGVSQKTLTDAINKIWKKLGELSGEAYDGINLTVNPEYFIGVDGCDIHINATTENVNGIFEKLEIYINGELLVSRENIDYFEYDTHVDDTSILMCKAQILGIEYTEVKTIARYNPFWIGAGTNYEQIMNISNLIPLNKTSHNISANNGDNIFVVIEKPLETAFIRADMSGVEIPFDRSEVVISNKVYVIFTSKNTYNTGTYNIDINS